MHRSSSPAGRLGVLVACAVAGAALLLLEPVDPVAAKPCASHSGQHLAGRSVTASEAARGLACADLRGARLDRLQLVQEDLSGADLRGASLRGAQLGQADLTGADLTGADLEAAALEQATVTRTVLARVHARGAELGQLDLSGDSLVAADLRDADLSQSVLRRADLRRADLAGARLDQADLTGARLDGADLSGASLTEAVGTSTATGVASGAFPMDLWAALITLVLALAVLLPRARRHPGAAPAAVALAAVAAGTAAELPELVGWVPVVDDLILLPLLTPVLFLAMFVAGGLRRMRDGALAAAVALLALLGFFLLVAAGTAFVVGDLFQALPLVSACRTAGCLAGAARGGVGIGAGAVLILLTAVVARLRVLARRLPAFPDLVPTVVPPAGATATQPPAGGPSQVL